MADSDFNMIKSAESLQNIGLAPEKYRQEKKKKKILHKQQEQQAAEDDVNESPEKDIISEVANTDGDPHSIDYRA